jgi:very-short-patch-repair endonuclease
VPQLNIPNVGHVDFAIFDPHISTQNPLVVVECDGHNFHERTSNQASEDRRRDRVLQWLGYPLLRFTGTDIVRNKTEVAREIAEFVDQRLSEKHAHLAEVAEREAEFTELMYHRYGVL